MTRFLLVLSLGLTLLGCGTKPKLSDSDRRDAKLALERLQFATKGVAFEQSNPDKPSSHADPEGKTYKALIREADETRAKAKGTAIEPEVSRLCLALTAYWELPDGKDPKAKAAAAEADQAKAALQAVADGK